MHNLKIIVKVIRIEDFVYENELTWSIRLESSWWREGCWDDIKSKK